MNSFIETNSSRCGEADTVSISELRQNLSPEKFEKAFKAFLKQADANAISKKSDGLETPFGIENRMYDGANLHLHYGQGAASKTPYMNWWVLSIYYVVDTQMVYLGIEKERRYPYLEKLNPPRYKELGNKKESVAIFYSRPKDAIDYPALYEKFITTAEEIIRLGME